MITRAITAIRLTDQTFDEQRSDQSMITEKISARKLQQKVSADFQPQTQTTSVYSNPNLINTKTTESISPTDVTGISISSSSTLTPVLQYHCTLPKTLFEAILIFIMV